MPRTTRSTLLMRRILPCARASIPGARGAGRKSAARSERDGRGDQVADEREGMARAGEVIVHTLGDERAAQARAGFGELTARQPACAQDAAVERTRRIVIAHRAGERDAQEGAILVLGTPDIDAEQGPGLEAPRRFLEGFADDGFEEGLAILEVPGRLVDDHAAARAFFHEEESAVDLGDGRHGHVRFPYHARHYTCPGFGAALRNRSPWRAARAGSGSRPRPRRSRRGSA